MSEFVSCQLFECDTIFEYLELCLKYYCDNPAVKFYKGKDIKTKTYKQFIADIHATKTIVLNQFKNCKHVAIYGDLSYEWLVTFFALITSKIVAIPVNADDNVEILQNLSMMDSIDGIIYADKFKEKAIEVCGEHINCKPYAMSELVSENDENKIIYEYIKDKSVQPDDTAIVLYTSGTTGNNKPVMLTHKNLCFDYIQSTEGLKEYAKAIKVSATPLPSYHAFTICMVMVTFNLGACFCPVRSVKYFKNDCKVFNPTTIVVVPLVLNFVYKTFYAKLDKNKFKKFFTHILFGITNILLSIGVDIRHIYHKKVKEFFGDNINACVCGGGKLDLKVKKFINTIGIDCLEGYGATECAPVISINVPSYRRFNSVGLPLKKVDVKIENGEIIVKGGNVFKGYWGNDEETKKSLKDGWYKTNDLGFIDKKGLIHITGRKNNLLVLNNGENVVPEEIEEKFFHSEYIDTIIVGKKSVQGTDVLSAKIFYTNKKLSKQEIEKHINDDIAKVNKTLPAHKQIRDVEFIFGACEKNQLGKVTSKNR